MEQNQKQPSLKDDFEKMYQEKRSQEMHTESLKKALKKAENIISKLSDEKRDQAQSYFDKITKGKTLTEADAKEYAEMATLYVSRDEIRE
jgi:restriction endonuclease